MVTLLMAEAVVVLEPLVVVIMAVMVLHHQFQEHL
jgi:hypothetical protein